MKKTPKVNGRPTDYREEYCQQLIKHMTEGGDFQGFAGLVGVSKQTLYDWLDKHPNFVDAKKKGTMRSYVWWEKVGREYIVSKEGKSVNTGLYMINMRNRFNWINANAPVSPEPIEVDNEEIEKELEEDEFK